MQKSTLGKIQATQKNIPGNMKKNPAIRRNMKIQDQSMRTVMKMKSMNRGTKKSIPVTMGMKKHIPVIMGMKKSIPENTGMKKHILTIMETKKANITKMPMVMRTGMNMSMMRLRLRPIWRMNSVPTMITGTGMMSGRCRRRKRR